MDKVLPNNPEAERSVLGSIFLNRDAMVPVASWLQAADFYQQRHEWIFEAMLSCYRERIPPDLVSISERLRQAGRLESIGGLPYLMGLVNEVPSSYHVEHYGKIVQRLATLRRLIVAGGRITALGYQDDRELDGVIADAQAEMAAIIAGNKPRGGLVSISDVMHEVYEYLNDDAALPFVPTGLYEYDAMTGGGLWPGELVIPAGRPGHGKSAFVGTVAVNVASQQRKNAAVFSLEMQRLSLGIRYLAMQSGVDGGKIRRRELKDSERQQAIDSMGQMDYPLYLDDVRIGVDQIRQRCLQFASERGPLSLVVVDYLQLVKPNSVRGANREREVTDIAEGLKELSQELKCTVMAPAQLNRAIESRSDPKPTLADLRESGGIEQTADQVVFVVRPELFDPQEAKYKNIGLLYIEKQRNEKTGIVPLRWDGARTCYTNLDRMRTPEGY